MVAVILKCIKRSHGGFERVLVRDPRILECLSVALEEFTRLQNKVPGSCFLKPPD